MCSTKAVLSLQTKVVAACGSINPWLKPFDRRMYFFVMCQSGWLGLVFVCMQMNFGPERPQFQADRPRRVSVFYRLPTEGYTQGGKFR
jgi:hypothetical protein